jgi:hypothetical protein
VSIGNSQGPTPPVQAAGESGVKLLDWANDIRSAVGLGSGQDCDIVERRREARREVSGKKVIVRQRKALGIMYLKNLSSKGGCGLTDMPLAVGSLVFLQLRKPLYFAAEVRWVRSLAIGLEFLRPIRPKMFEGFRGGPRDGQAGLRKPKQ